MYFLWNFGTILVLLFFALSNQGVRLFFSLDLQGEMTVLLNPALSEKCIIALSATMNTGVNPSTSVPSTPSASSVPTPPPVTSMPGRPIKKSKVPMKYILAALVLLLLIVGVVVAMYLNQRNQDLRQQAAGGEDTYGCASYTTAQLCVTQSGGNCTWSNSCIPYVAASLPPGGDGQRTSLLSGDCSTSTVCQDIDGCSCSVDCNTKFPAKGESCGGLKTTGSSCGTAAGNISSCGGVGCSADQRRTCQADGTWGPCEKSNTCTLTDACQNLGQGQCNGTAGCTWNGSACIAGTPSCSTKIIKVDCENTPGCSYLDGVCKETPANKTADQLCAENPSRKDICCTKPVCLPFVP